VPKKIEIPEMASEMKHAYGWTESRSPLFLHCTDFVGRMHKIYCFGKEK